jgi:hypothetical protein
MFSGNVVNGLGLVGGEVYGLCINRGVSAQDSWGFYKPTYTEILNFFNLLISLFYTKSTPPISTTTCLI